MFHEQQQMCNCDCNFIRTYLLLDAMNEVGRNVLELVDSYRYFGVLVTSKLSCMGRPYQPYMQQSLETCWNAIQAVLHLG